MNQSAALCAGNRKRWQQQWSKEPIGNTSCSGRSNWPPTNTERRWTDGETRRRPLKQKDFSVNESVSCTGAAWRQTSLHQVFQVAMPLPGWSFRVRFSSTLLLPSTHRISCRKRSCWSLLSDYCWCSCSLFFFSSVLFRLTCFLSEEQWTQQSDITPETTCVTSVWWANAARREPSMTCFNSVFFFWLCTWKCFLPVCLCSGVVGVLNQT